MLIYMVGVRPFNCPASGNMGNKILIIATGGTIASVASEQGLTPGLSGEILKEKLLDKERFPGVQIDTLQLMNLDSTDVYPEEWCKMREAILSNYDKYDGFVVLHGTDSLAFTASALSLVFPLSKPIILTGSMKTVDEEDSDAKKNFNNAINFAMSPLKGVYVDIFEDPIPGDRVTKISTNTEKAFKGRNWTFKDPMHTAYSNDHVKYGELLPDAYSNIPGNFDDRVISIPIIPGLSSDMLEYACERPKGVILEVMGAGGIPTRLLESVKKIAAEKPVLLIAQVYEGGLNLNEYAVGQNAIRAGVIDGKDLTREAAITRLMWALAYTSDLNMIKEIIEKGKSFIVDAYLKPYNTSYLRQEGYQQEIAMPSSAFVNLLKKQKVTD